MRAPQYRLHLSYDEIHPEFNIQKNQFGLADYLFKSGYIENTEIFTFIPFFHTLNHNIHLNLPQKFRVLELWTEAENL